MSDREETVPSMRPGEVDERLRDDDEPLALLDVRREDERRYVHLEDDLWVPMDRVDTKLEEIRQLERPLVVYCHHGIRSHRVARFLKQEGMDDVYNLAGGIDAWAQRVDPDLPRY